MVGESPFKVGAKVAFTRAGKTSCLRDYEEIEIFREGIIEKVTDDGDFFLVGDNTQYWAYFEQDYQAWIAENSPFKRDDETHDGDDQEDVSYEFLIGEFIEIYDEALSNRIESQKKVKLFLEKSEKLITYLSKFPEIDLDTGKTNVTDEILALVDRLLTL